MDSEADQGVVADEIIWHSHRYVTRERPIRQNKLFEDLSVALLLFARDCIDVFNLVRDKDLGEIASPKVAVVMYSVFEDVNQSTFALHCHSMLTRHVDWPLDVPVLPALAFFVEDSIAEIEGLDRFEMTVEEYATKPTADVYYVRGAVGQPNGIWVEEIAVANTARHGQILT